MSFNPDTVNRPQLADDIENVQASADRYYQAQGKGNQMAAKSAWDEHQAVLAAFKTKYGSLRVRPSM
jgi:DNA-binding GntR family transcriptional regulator